MNNSQSIPYIVIDEISLEGLDGITVESLWRRIATRLKYPYPMNDNFTSQIWPFVAQHDELSFYELEEPRQLIKTFDRSEIIDYEYAQLEECPYTSYKYTPITDGVIRGSCQDYTTRMEVPRENLVSLTLDETLLNWGQKLIIVASQRLRETVLIPSVVSSSVILNIHQYCILERIGRSRFNGEITQGKFAMTDTGEPNNFFHSRKTLLKNRLIKKQTYYEKIGDHNSTGLLLHLPRFYFVYKPKHMILTEQVVEFLKTLPNCVCDYATMRDHFPIDAHNSLRKLYQMGSFQQFVYTDLKVPYRTLYPNALESEWRIKKTVNEKPVRVLQLRNPNQEVFDMWPRDNSDDEEDCAAGFLDQTKTRLDHSLINQAYEVIDETESVGITQSEIATRLGLTKLHARTIVRNLIRLKQITSYMSDASRQRTSRYILWKYKANADETMHKFESITTADDCALDTSFLNAPKLETPKSSNDGVAEITPPKISDDIHVNDVQVDIESIERPAKMKIRKLITEATMTDRMAHRMTIIVKAIKQLLVIEDVFKVMQILLREEKRLGYKDEMCRRSIYRLLTKLSLDKRIRLWRITLKYQTTSNEFMFLTDPKIEPEHSLFVSLLEKEKFRFLLRVSNERNRLNHIKAAKEKPLAAPPTPKPPIEKKKKLTVFDQKVNYGNTPKFIRMRTLHEFLYFLVYAYPVDIKPIDPKNAFDLWRIEHPHLDPAEILPELSPVYSLEIGWSMFVPPLLPNSEFPPGWLLVNDFLIRLPLSIFVKIYNVNFEIPGLDAILIHPIRKHYLLHYLPMSIQNDLIGSRKHVFAIDEVIRRCCAIGLLQFGPQRQSQKDQIYVYINKYASIVNTIDSEPGYVLTTELDYPRQIYSFDSMDAITRYWHDLYRICLNTRLGKRMSLGDTETLRWDVRMISEWQPRTIADVVQLDIGGIPGDGRGAGGLDSSFYAHLQRNWSFKRIRYKTRSVRAERKPPAIKMRASRRPHPTVVKNEKRIVVVPLKRYVKPKSSKISIKSRKRIRQPNYDDVDKQALRLMRKLRVDWSPEEDNFLLLCKVATLVLSPSRRVTTSSQQVRDLLHWHLKAFDKTSRACQRRILYMMRNESIASSVYLCMQEFNDNKEISRKFSRDVYQRLRRQIKPEDDFVRALKILYVECVFTLQKHFKSITTRSCESRNTILPDTVDEFHELFNAKPEEYTHNSLKYSDPINRNDIDGNTLVTLIHSSVCCANDKTSWSIQLYEIYKNYSEQLLGEAMTKVRNDQLISANKMSNQNKLSIRNLPLSSSPYHLSVRYQHMMLSKVSYDTFGDALQLLQEICENRVMKNIPFGQINGGRCITLAEMLHSGLTFRCNVVVPKVMLVIDSQKFQDNTYNQRIQNRFRSILPYINQEATTSRAAEDNAFEAGDFEKHRLITALKRKQRRVTISISDPKTIEYYVSPIEKLMKMDECFYHFYCLLAKLGTSVYLPLLSINKDHLCQFDCLLGRPNAVADAIEIIKAFGPQLVQIDADEQLDLSEEHTVDIDEHTILVIFNILVNRRFSVDEEDVYPSEDITDHGMLQLSLDILRGEEAADMTADESVSANVSQELEWFTQTPPDQKPVIVGPVDDDDGGDDDEVVMNTRISHEDFAGNKVHKMHDFFYLNSCKMTLSLMDDVNQEVMVIGGVNVPNALVTWEPKKKDALLERITKDAIWPRKHLETDDFVMRMRCSGFEEVEIENGLSVLRHLEAKNELGSTNVELLGCFDYQLLLKTLKILIEMKMVMRTGIVEVIFVHERFTTPWILNTYHMKRLQRETIVPVPFKLMKLSEPSSPSPLLAKRKHSESEPTTDDAQPEKIARTEPSRSKRATRFTKVTINQNAELPSTSQTPTKTMFHLQISPWIRVNGSLNRRVLDRWMGLVLAYCMSHAGVTILRIATRFNLMQPIHLRTLLEYLQELECIRLKTIRKQPAPNLWAKYESPVIEIATYLDSNDSVFVEVLPDAIIKHSLFIGDKKYSTDFIKLTMKQSA